MDDRQTQIREGAGLEESKLNVEFIDWLRRWSTPIMGVIACVALGFIGYNKLEQRRAAAVDRAFEELAAAADQASPSPQTLKTVAAENSGIRGVPILAELEAADVYFRSVRTGLRIGAKVDQDGTVAAEEVLSAEQKETNLAEAERLYKKILDETGSDPKKAVHAIGAAYGLAAVAESRGNQEAARQSYERVVKIAEYSGLTAQSAIAKKRIEALATLGPAPKLYAKAELPKPPEPPKPDAGATGATGSTAPTGGVFVPIPTAPTGETPASTPPAAPTGEAPASPAPTGTEPPKPAPTPAPEAPKPADPKPSDPK